MIDRYCRCILFLMFYFFSGVGQKDSGVGQKDSGVGQKDSGVGQKDSGVGRAHLAPPFATPLLTV
jgi:hypothetical protein